MAGKGPPKGPKLTVDAWTVDSRGRVLLVRRGRAPFRGRWSLPGGFVDVGETTEQACAREVAEETGVEVEIGEVRGVYSDPRRDPRRHTVTVLYEATPVGGTARAGDDASDARWFTPAEVARLDLAFDHAEIAREQLARRRRARAEVSGRRARPRGARRLGRARRGGARG